MQFNANVSLEFCRPCRRFFISQAYQYVCMRLFYATPISILLIHLFVRSSLYILFTSYYTWQYKIQLENLQEMVLFILNVCTCVNFVFHNFMRHSFCYHLVSFLTFSLACSLATNFFSPTCYLNLFMYTYFFTNVELGIKCVRRFEWEV